jgi:hypothetical protein
MEGVDLHTCRIGRHRIKDPNMIEITKIDDVTYKVVVKRKVTTTHEVRVTETYYQKLTGGRITVEDLIEKSFEFLLEREPNTSILRTFDLPVIGHYFAEYEHEILKRVA